MVSKIKYGKILLIEFAYGFISTRAGEEWITSDY